MSKTESNSWFRLDTDFRKDDKFVKLKEKYGREIACLFIEIISCMYEQPGGDLKRRTYMFELLADECGATVGLVEQTIKAACEVLLLLRDNDNDVWYSKRVRYEIAKRKEIVEVNSRRGQAGARKRWGKENAPTNTQSNASTNAQSISGTKISSKTNAQSISQSNSQDKTRQDSNPLKGGYDVVEGMKSGGSALVGPTAYRHQHHANGHSGPVNFTTSRKSFVYFRDEVFPGVIDDEKITESAWFKLSPNEREAACDLMDKFTEQFDECPAEEYLEGKFWTHVK